MNRIRLRAAILQYVSLAMVIALVVIMIVRLSANAVSSKSIYDVAPPVLNAFSNDRSAESTERFLKKYYGLNASDYEAMVLYFPITNMDAQELLLLKLRDTSQAEEVISACENRRQTQIGIYEGYAPEQLAMCENAILDVQGNYILYVVHPEADEVDEIFRKSLR